MLLILINFDGGVSRRMQSNTSYVVYSGWKAGMLCSRYVYGGHYGTNNAQIF